MTIAALHALLDQELPHVRRPPAPRLPRTHFSAKETPVQTATAAAQHTTPPTLRKLPDPAPAPAAEPETIPVGQLLAWGDNHEDPTIQDQSARVRAGLAGLRTRHQADKELEAITTEAQQLEQRLAELRERQAELQPAKPKTRKPTRDYEPAEVRAWARAHGHTVPDRGQIPKAVLTAWRKREANT